MAAQQAATPTMKNGDARVARDPVEMRRRNRRLALYLVLFLIVATVLCALYIGFVGGSNKGPMEPYHSMIETR